MINKLKIIKAAILRLIFFVVSLSTSGVNNKVSKIETNNTMARFGTNQKSEKSPEIATVISIDVLCWSHISVPPII